MEICYRQKHPAGGDWMQQQLGPRGRCADSLAVPVSRSRGHRPNSLEVRPMGQPLGHWGRHTGPDAAKRRSWRQIRRRPGGADSQEPGVGHRRSGGAGGLLAPGERGGVSFGYIDEVRHPQSVQRDGDRGQDADPREFA